MQGRGLRLLVVWILIREHKQYVEYSPKQCSVQRAKKVVSDSPGLVDFAIGLVNKFLFLTCLTSK